MAKNMVLSSLEGDSWKFILAEMMRIMSREWDQNEQKMMDAYLLIGVYLEDTEEFIHCNEKGMNFEFAVYRMGQYFVHNKGVFYDFDTIKKDNENGHD